jgi:hypothetical protein
VWALESTIHRSERQYRRFLHCLVIYVYNPTISTLASGITVLNCAIVPTVLFYCIFISVQLCDFTDIISGTNKNTEIYYYSILMIHTNEMRTRTMRLTSILQGLVLLMTLLNIVNTTEELKTLNAVAFLSQTGTIWPGGWACQAAMQMALDHIEDREDILDGYTINMTWTDTQVSWCLLCLYVSDYCICLCI